MPRGREGCQGQWVRLCCVACGRLGAPTGAPVQCQARFTPLTLLVLPMRCVWGALLCPFAGAEREAQLGFEPGPSGSGAPELMPCPAASQRESSGATVCGLLARAFQNLGDFISLAVSFYSNLRKVKAAPAAKRPFTRRCRTPWAGRTRTLACRQLPRGTTRWSTPGTTTPPSPGRWTTPPGKSVRTWPPAATLGCGPRRRPGREREPRPRGPVLTRSSASFGPPAAWGDAPTRGQ